MGPYLRPVALTGADQVVMSHAGLYAGFTIRETAGAPAVVRLFDNASAAAGTVLEEIGLDGFEATREAYPNPIWAENGIYVDVVSGSVVGSVRIV